MNINWKVRLLNPTFWKTFIPSLLIVVQLILTMFGVEIDLGEIGNKILAVINAVLALVAAVGVTADPTTKGFSDSERAMTYDKPN